MGENRWWERFFMMLQALFLVQVLTAGWNTSPHPARYAPKRCDAGFANVERIARAAV